MSKGPIDMRMMGMTHLYGKIVLNVKINFLPQELLDSSSERDNIFKVLTNTNLPVEVRSSYMDHSSYTYVIIYDFKKVEPIPEFLTRIEVKPEIKAKYFNEVAVTPLFLKINPAYMARQDEDQDMLLV